jgi:hypothetical protein
LFQLLVAVAGLEPKANLRQGQRRAVGVFHLPGQGQCRFQGHIQVGDLFRQFHSGREIVNLVTDHKLRTAILHLPLLKHPGEAVFAIRAGLGPAVAVVGENRHLHVSRGLAIRIGNHALELV